MEICAVAACTCGFCVPCTLPPGSTTDCGDTIPTWLLAGVGALVVTIGGMPMAAAQDESRKCHHPSAAPPIECGLVDRDRSHGTRHRVLGKSRTRDCRHCIAQLVAEDLDVRCAPGDTDRTPNRGYTAGSQSLSVGSTPVRQAAAQARLALIAIAAAKLVQRHYCERARVQSSQPPMHPSPQLCRTRSRWSDRSGDRANIVLEAPSTYQVIGKPIARVDIPSKVDGSYR